MITKQWNTTLWAQQHYKINNFFMGNMVPQFLESKKEHTEKFKKWWFGAIELEMIPSQLNFGNHKLKNRFSIVFQQKIQKFRFKYCEGKLKLIINQ